MSNEIIQHFQNKKTTQHSSLNIKSWLSDAQRSDITSKNDWKALVIIIGLFFTYSLILYASIADSLPIIANVIFSISTGIVISEIFIMGHDACHQSFFSKRLWNNISGRICLLPSLHSFSLWDLSHNKTHHVYTNFKDKDTGWSPMTKKEYDRLSKSRQFLERIYRGFFGAGLYYFIEVWAKQMVIPINSFNSNKNKKQYFIDTFLVFVWAFLFPFLLVKISNIVSPDKSAIEVIFLGYIIPFFSWNWIMGFTVYLHHTHPNIPWYNSEEEWKLRKLQVYYSARITLPEPFQTLYVNINEHTAHHLLQSIPIYNLKKAQRQLEKVHGNKITVVENALLDYLDITRQCKLYDFERNCWTDFAGNQTGKLLPRLSLLKTDTKT